MSGSLGSGAVEYHEDRPLVHFGTPFDEVERISRMNKLREQGFETTERMPQ